MYGTFMLGAGTGEGNAQDSQEERLVGLKRNLLRPGEENDLRLASVKASKGKIWL